MGLDAMVFVFWILSFKPAFSLSSFTFIKRLFRSFLFSVIRVVSSAYLRLLIYLLAILIPACESSSPAFCMMYSAYKLNKQDDNTQPWCTPFPTLNQFIVLCLVPTVASCPTYKFLRRQMKSSVVPISLRIFQFVVIHIVKGFSVVNEMEVDGFFFFLNSLTFSMIQQMLAIWSLPCLHSAFTSGSSWFTYCWSLTQRILSITLLACEMSAIVR